MQHLRWANEMLWTLHRAGLISSYEPVLEPSQDVPTSSRQRRKRKLRRLDPATLRDFVEAEKPSGVLDGAYAPTVATLRDNPNYPKHLSDLAGRVLKDGTQHYWRLRYIEDAFKAYDSTGPRYPYLREMRRGTQSEASAALVQYELIKTNLRSGFSAWGDGI